MAFPPGSGGPPGAGGPGGFGSGGPGAGGPGAAGPGAGGPGGPAGGGWGQPPGQQPPAGGGGFGGPPAGGGGFGGPPAGGGGFGGPPAGGGGFGGPPAGGGGFGGPPAGGPGGFGGGMRGGPPQDPAKDEKSKAQLGMILSLVGLPLCCFPLSLAGGYMGYAAMNSAKKKSLKPPGTAYVAMVCAGLSVVLSLFVGIGSYMQHKAEQERLAGLADKLKGKRTQDKIDKETACLLAEERVVDVGFQGATNDPEDFACSGDFTINDNGTAQLTEVRFKILSDEYKATACLARGARWFVLKMTGDEECGKLYPPKQTSAEGVSEERLKKMEQEARDGQLEEEAKELVSVYKKSLVKIRESVKELPDQKFSACDGSVIDKRLGSRSKLKIKTIDYAVLNSQKGKGSAKWKFLTSDELRNVMKDGSARDKKDDIQTLKGESGNMVLVYAHFQRDWPVVEMKGLGGDFNFDGGVYQGYMMLYDLKTGERLCHAELIAQNSNEVTYREGRFSSNKAKAEAAVFEDFKDNFKETATKNIKRMNGKLRLGYKWLE